MEKQASTFSISKLIASVRSAGSAGMDVSSVWRLFLSTFCLALLGVALFAYLTYNWASSDDTPTTPSIGSRDTQTIAELKEVITSYQQKEKAYLSLMAAPPPAPGFQRGAGVALPSTLDFEAETTPAASSSGDLVLPPRLTTTTPRIID